MSASGAASGVSALAPEARKPSRYESQKRRDWQTFVRYLAAHRPPLVLRRCSGAHVLEFLRYLDRFGKTRVHAPPCLAYGVRATTTTALAPCQCPLQQAWGSLDALVGRLRAAFDERHGGGEKQHDATCCNPFAARAVRLYLRDVRDAQSRARGISYRKKKKKRKLAAGSIMTATSSSKNGGGIDVAADGERQQPGPLRGHKTATTTTMMTNAAPVLPQLPPLPPCLVGVPFEYCDTGSMVVNAPGCYSGVYLPLLFNAFS